MLPLGTDADSYQWKRMKNRVFCMDEEGQVVFVIDAPSSWREAMLCAFEAS